MQILSFIIWYFILYLFGVFTEESPHGKDLNISCSKCHSSNSWSFDRKTYTFDHSSTKMALKGAHKEINCKLCHPTLVFSEAKAKTESVNCHTDIHSQTVDNFCDRCHTSESWIVNNITEIHQQSRFPLIGVHTMTECQKCHKSESLHKYDVQGVECVDCHRDNYMATTNPNHASVQFSTDCSQCHNIFSYEWGGTGFNHNFFPLTQGHANVICAKCHADNNFSNLSTECYSCHKPDYDAALNPAHNGDCFSTNCLICHTTNPGWTPVTFQHNTIFSLTLGHAEVSCSKCHINGNCSGTPSDCYTCHKANYDATTNPVHSGGCYSSNCLVCHTVNPGWSPVSFQHENYFPINSGKHSGFTCNQCHINTANCSYSCIDCHDHDKPSMDNKHSGVGGYSWVSTACFNCHPKGITND